MNCRNDIKMKKFAISVKKKLKINMLKINNVEKSGTFVNI